MTDLSKFNINSKFPAVAKTNQISGSCSLNAQSVAPYATAHNTVTLTVGSGDILNIALLVDGEYIADAKLFASGSMEGFLYEYAVERVSATQIQLTIAATNYGASTATCDAKTATAYVDAFSVP